MLNRNYQKTIKKKSNLPFLVLSLLIAVSLIMLYTNITPVIHSAAVTQGNLYIQKMVNDTVNTVLTNNAAQLNDILTITYQDDTNQKISSIGTNTLLITQMKNDVTKALIGSFNMGETTKFRIALSTLLGYDFLMGSKMFCNLYINPFTSIDCNVESVFEDAGINQTKISLVLKVYCTSDISVGSHKQTIQVNNEFLLAQKHIIGTVPFSG